MLNSTDYTRHKYTDTTPKSFPVYATVRACMLLSFSNRIHTNNNRAIENGATIKLVGKSGGLYVFVTSDGYTGHCTADAFEIVVNE